MQGKNVGCYGQIEADGQANTIKSRYTENEEKYACEILRKILRLN